MQITIDIPDDFVQHLIPPGQDPARALLEDAAIKAFSTAQISRAQLRSLLHIETRYEFYGFLKQRDIDRDAYSAAQLEQDVQTLRDLKSL